MQFFAIFFIYCVLWCEYCYIPSVISVAAFAVLFSVAFVVIFNMLVSERLLFVELQIQFAQFDRDADGVISHQELTEVMTSLGWKIDSETVKKVLQRADVDGLWFICVCHSLLCCWCV